MRKILLLLIVCPLFFTSYSSNNTSNLAVLGLESKHCTFDLIELAGMVEKPYSVVARSLINCNVNEEVLAGVRTATYSFKDGEISFLMDLEESPLTANKIYEIIIRPSFKKKYSEMKQLEMFIRYIQIAEANSNLSSGSGYNHENGGNLNTDEVITLLKDNPESQKKPNLSVAFYYKENIEILVSYRSNKFLIGILSLLPE